MENSNLYQDIQSRTDGDIYVGVVGPVRTGKSTFRMAGQQLPGRIRSQHSPGC